MHSVCIVGIENSCNCYPFVYIVMCGIAGLRLFDMRVCIFTVLRKQVSFGFKDCGSAPEVVTFLNMIFPRLKDLLACSKFVCVFVWCI
jgi:hypothetical protein